MSANELPPPTAQGDLARTPFAHALLFCQQRSLSGTLVVWPEDAASGGGQDRIRLKDGVPVAARLSVRAASLDRGLLPLFPRRSGPYAFYADLDLVGEGEQVRTGRVDPLMLIAASLRGPTRDDIVDSVLAGFAGPPIRMRPGTDIKRLELLPKEMQFFDVVRASPATIDELVAQCELGPQSARRLLYLLAITKCIEPWTGSIPAPASSTQTASTQTASTQTASTPVPPSDASPPAPAAAPSSSAPRQSLPPGSKRSKFEAEPVPAPPPDLTSEQLTLWNEIAAYSLAIEKQNYFEMLAIARDVGAEGVRKAYFTLVKKWHPDRLPADLVTIKPWIDRIFHHLTGAHDTLCDEKKRGNYLRTIDDGGGTPESERQLAAIIQAAMDQQKAEVLLKRRDVEGALALLEGALELNPEDADVHATYAWALFLSASPPSPSVMLASLDRALSMSPKNDRAHYYRGMVLRKAGREAEALASFEKAAEFNPKNHDAMREVRISQMRGTSAPPQTAAGAKPQAGIFSKLFGGKKEK